jgi:transcriptional regulator of arginine metabolism
LRKYHANRKVLVEKMKISRQSKIIELINKYDIETQEELADRLMKDGYNVTQATVSRDIRELKLTKVAVDGGRQKYIVLQKTEPGMSEKYTRVLRDGFVSMDMAQNIMVVKTVPGMAMAVAAALDALQLNSIVGCIAGDDTVLCAIRSVDETIAVMERLNKLLNAD